MGSVYDIQILESRSVEKGLDALPTQNEFGGGLGSGHQEEGEARGTSLKLIWRGTELVYCVCV